VRHVVLAGAGHAHVQVLKRFAASPPPDATLTLITRTRHTPYSGMLPGQIAGLYDFHETHIDTVPLSDHAGAQCRLNTVTGIDRARKMVICDDGEHVPYDILSIDTGSTPNLDRMPGGAVEAIPVKPIDGFLERFEAMRKRILERRAKAHIALVGDGAGGVELMLSVERRLRREVKAAGLSGSELSFTLIGASERILPGFPESFAARFEALCERRFIRLQTGSRVTQVEPGKLTLDGGGAVQADEVLWVTQASAPGWLKGTGLELDDRGFLRVDQHLNALGEPDIFAAGDVIAFEPRPLPKSGVYAVRSGPVLAENIRNRLAGKALTAFKPQQTALYLISTGTKHAIGTRNGLVFAGQWVWHLKDWIDRRFMDQFRIAG